MQPYFLPYIGYYQLINSVDQFIVYDNIEFSKSGWFHRNRFLSNGEARMFSLPIKKASDYLFVNQRFLAENSLKLRKKILNQIENAYRKAPNFSSVYPILEPLLLTNKTNLFDIIYDSINATLNYLEINTPVKVSSQIHIDHRLKGKDKILAICNELKCEQYINPIGGKALYNKEYFEDNGVEISFIESNEIVYKQFKNDFVPWLSILDVMMFNSVETIHHYLNNYSLT